MNESGGPVSALLDFYKVPLDRLVVVHDELDLPFGALRLKLGGGDNGHNGLKSIAPVARAQGLLPGAGRHRPPPGRMDPPTSCCATSRRRAQGARLLVDRAADAVESLVTEGLERAQNSFNT